ncbi:MAG: DNA adenine methylase [Candidatus Hodarchaeota archaeon]
MGSKRKLASSIYQLIKDQIQLNGVNYFFDLFAGTNSVAEVFKKDCPIITNDIQEYSYQIALALIKNKNKKVNSSDLENLNQIVKDKYNSLSHKFNKYLKIEDEIISNRKIRKYAEFIDSFPHANNKNAANHHELSYLFSKESINSYRTNGEYLLFTTYFNNSYFSLKQCLQIDSLRFAIDNITNGWSEDETQEIIRAIYLTCLMSAMSIAVNSTSHFAQFHKLNEKNFNWIIERRRKDIFKIFNQKIIEFNNSFIPTKFSNICLTKDYKSVFEENNNLLENTKIVYIDPPYSCAPYSRFYHLLETLVMYDYPESLYDGRYRGDRYVSGFNRKREVKKEFTFLLDNMNHYNFSVLFSYPLFNDLNFNADDLVELCSKYYDSSKLKVEKIGQNRQAFGNKKAKNGQIEYLILCKK